MDHSLSPHDVHTDGDSGNLRHTSHDLATIETYAHILVSRLLIVGAVVVFFPNVKGLTSVLDSHTQLRWSAAKLKHVVAIARRGADRLLEPGHQEQGQQEKQGQEQQLQGQGQTSEGSLDARWIHNPSAAALSLPVRDRQPATGVISEYQEAQLHGPVSLKHDVARLVAHASHKKNPSMLSLLKEFGVKHGVPVVWMDEGV